MLGPALTLLLEQLESRADALTGYEMRVCSELQAIRKEGAVLGPGVRKMAGAGSPLMHNESMHTILEPDDEEEEPRLQINCGKTDCPNKKFKKFK